MLSRLCLLILASSIGASCSAPRYPLSGQEYQRFMAAGPVQPELDRDALLLGIAGAGPYRISVGDLLEVQAPRALFAQTTDQTVGPTDSVHLARVDAAGMIQVPLLGAVDVRGRTLIETESVIASMAHPRYLVAQPSIVVQVVDYSRMPIAVVGAVQNPGIHELRSDHMTLYGALTAAGGIQQSGNLVVGARLIRVRSPGTDESEDIVLPVKGLNVPYSDLALSGGETIEVMRYEPDTFTVVGLVRTPGAFEYPPEVTYNLMQALVIAGGVDTIADPPWATVFRKDASDRIIPATFKIKGDGLVQSSKLPIKPGDVIVIEHTAASWTRSLLSQIVNLQFGVYAGSRP